MLNLKCFSPKRKLKKKKKLEKNENENMTIPDLWGIAKVIRGKLTAKCKLTSGNKQNPK